MVLNILYRYDVLAAVWIISYLLENFRTIHRVYRFSGHDTKMPDGASSGANCMMMKVIFKRWFTFRNIYTLATDLAFLISLILKGISYSNK